ncbi:unnamed protein product, partial [Mesorhabditis spiculigera]
MVEDSRRVGPTGTVSSTTMHKRWCNNHRMTSALLGAILVILLMGVIVAAMNLCVNRNVALRKEAEAKYAELQEVHNRLLARKYPGADLEPGYKTLPPPPAPSINAPTTTTTTVSPSVQAVVPVNHSALESPKPAEPAKHDQIIPGA